MRMDGLAWLYLAKPDRFSESRPGQALRRMTVRRTMMVRRYVESVRYLRYCLLAFPRQPQYLAV